MWYLTGFLGPRNKPWGYEVLGRPRKLRPRACSHLLQEHSFLFLWYREKDGDLTIHLPWVTCARSSLIPRGGPVSAHKDKGVSQR